METRTCHFCSRSVGAKEYCNHCVVMWNLRPRPEEMTPDGREAEMRSLGGPMEVPFDLMHQRMEQLVGRPVWTHEMGLNWDGLCKEARWEGRAATMQEVIELIPEEKRIILVADEKPT